MLTYFNVDQIIIVIFLFKKTTTKALLTPNVILINFSVRTVYSSTNSAK